MSHLLQNLSLFLFLLQMFHLFLLMRNVSQ
nr:MAG TPA: hypothetical protein [Caudoviricetes sp.]